MADILKYTCKAREVNYRYKEIHNDIFSLSVRKLVTGLFAEQSDFYKKYIDELKSLEWQLKNIQTDLNVLPHSEIKILRGKDILLALSDYVTALSHSINYLQKICNDKSRLSGPDSNLVNDKKFYDDAIQHHKNLGDRLNGLLSNF